jgi:hypothetical protein
MRPPRVASASDPRSFALNGERRMRNAGSTLEVIGIILILAGLVNHFALNPRFSPVLHTSAYLFAAGAIAALVGLVVSSRSGRNG